MTEQLNKSKITNEFLTALGQAVLDFGFMESVIRTTLITLAREDKLAKALIPPGNSVSENLELLTRLCNSRVHQDVIKNWIELIDDIRSLFLERNKIFHGMFFQTDEKLFLAKTKKGKNGANDIWLQTEFNPNSIQSTLTRLNNLRRQLMDFVGDFSNSDDGPQHPPSQEAHPSLTINSKD